MLPFKRTFEGEKRQLRELSCRLQQCGSRGQHLEQENLRLSAQLRSQRRSPRPGPGDELRALRRAVLHMSFEKSQAELEAERLRGQLRELRDACSRQREACGGIGGELRGCSQDLHRALRDNQRLQQRLLQLQRQRRSLEEAHRAEMERLRVRAGSGALLSDPGPPAASVEELHRYARDLSEGWILTLETSQRQVEEMEQAMREGQEALGRLRRDKELCASQLLQLRAEAEQQGRLQLRLQEQMLLMEEGFREDCSEYQMIIEQLEEERAAMAKTIAERVKEHQQLLQVKMDLGMEVSAYRALLEGERTGLHETNRRMTQQQRERVIDIRLPAQPYTQRASTSRHSMETRYSTPMSNLRRSPVPLPGSRGTSRVVPISVVGRAQHQSPASRRDMVSFAKARSEALSAASAANANTDKGEGAVTSEKTEREEVVKVKKAFQEEDQVSPIKSSPVEARSVTTTAAAGSESEASREPDVCDSNSTDVEKPESTSGPSEKKALDSVSVEELIEKVIKPAGLEAKVCSSGDSKLTYHVEKTKQEDGTTKTQIVLESKVEEELDFSKDATLDELLNQGAKKMSLEDIKDTATGTMIKDLLSGLQGSGNLENKSVNVEIIEEPAESLSDEEIDTMQQVTGDFYEPPTRYFQIEELETVSDDTQFPRNDEDTSTLPTEKVQVSSVQVQEVSSKSESSYFSHDQEPREYFVSTPDDNLSEHEEGITSYGHYGVVDDLSDERYYQDQDLFPRKVIVEQSEEGAFLPGGHSFPREAFQPKECVIEEEVRVSPVVQESMLEFLKEDSLEPKEQLKGALEKLQSSVSGPLREELAFLTRVSSDSPENVAVDVRKVQQSSDNGTTTIVTELNVSQTLEDPRLLEGGEGLSEEQIMAALRASDLGLEKAFQGRAEGGYTFKISKDESMTYGGEFGGFADKGEYAAETIETEMSATLGTPVKISQEQRVATVYLESPADD